MAPSIPLFSRYSHAYLLTLLILIVGVQPFFQEHALGSAIIRILLFFCFASAAFSCSTTRRQLIGFLLCYVPMLATGIAWWITEDHTTEAVYFSLSGVCAAYIVALILGQIFRARYISANIINGALSVYLVIGLLWIFLYMILETLQPGSFRFARDTEEWSKLEYFKHFVGFSYITLTTLGYGNITPTSPQADALATMEAITGQIYLTILVARLVGIQVSQDALKIAKLDAESARETEPK